MEIFNTVLGSGLLIAIFSFLFKNYSDKRTEMFNQKKEIYTNLAQSLRVFINDSSESQKTAFLNSYASVLLWASDDIAKKVGSFLNYVIAGIENQITLKSLYADIIIEMRKDVGFPKTTLKLSDIQFVKFSEEK